jgi:hypothetical protein
MLRVLLGALAAGVVVFFWGAIAHMFTPIGDLGILPIPNEDNVLRPMSEVIRESGFYFFPGRDRSKPMSKSDEEAWVAKINKGPTGIMIVQPKGAEMMSPKQLGTEFATGVVAALLAGIVLMHVNGNYATRALVVILMAAFGAVSILVSYWNWFGFPSDYIFGAVVDEMVGWALGGLVLAAIVRPAPQSKSPAPATV